MSQLKITLLGGVRIQHNAWLGEVKVTRVVQGLLAFLVLQRHRAHSRETLTALFWGDISEDRARNCLNTTLWRLRSLLEPEGVAKGTYLITPRTGEVGFNSNSDYWLDIEELEREIGPFLAGRVQAVVPEVAQACEQALSLYAGELLEGFNDNWAVMERERVRQLYLDTCTRMLEHYLLTSQFDKGVGFGQHLLRQDMLREDVHRLMMHLYAANGQRTLAIQQFQHCEEVLAEELGVAPMSETVATLNQITEGQPDATQPAQVMSPQLQTPDLLDHLNRMKHQLSSLQHQLHDAIRAVELGSSYHG